MTTAVKICGLQSADQIRQIKNLSIDYVGFVFAPSKRQVTPTQTAEAIQELSVEGIRCFQAAGVFVNPSLVELREVLAEAALDVVQLHGAEQPAFCAEVKEQFGVKVFKAFSLNEQLWTNEQVKSVLAPYQGTIDAALLDTYDPVYGGGSGKTFRWEVIPVWKKAARELGIPLFVAGGLHEGNIADLIDKYEPDGVDVSSGVETDGVKDIKKIRIFVERVKNR
ncbi:phosphoribosylanthranilate isomerase [Marinicrinis lubricantis]|uniref:N-(5'-phosphoribosyl)anthranilate isomerase n=1 Tax=Marinicrinis lubricantis TaxID=2086470 RepID=A0ABW1IM10_9BACL